MKISTAYTKNKGFTLIELLVVITILATLAAVSGMAILGKMESARASTAKKTCTDIISGVENFMADNNNAYPFIPPGVKGMKSKVEDLGRENLLLITSEGRDGNLIAVLANRADSDTERFVPNKMDTVYIKTDMADNPGDPGLYKNDKGQYDLFDPWGNPYYVVFCTTDRGGCYDPYTGKCHNGKQCMAFSLGPDGEGAPDVGAVRKALNVKGRGKIRWDDVTIKSTKSADDEDAVEDNVFSWK